MFGWRRRQTAESEPAVEVWPRALGRLLEGLVGAEPQVRPHRRDNPDAVVDCAVYQQGVRRAGPIHYRDAPRLARRRGAFVWLGLHEPDAATMAAVAEAYGLHELTVEQALAGGHRPATESIGGVFRLVLRTARYVEHAELTATSEVVDTG